MIELLFKLLLLLFIFFIKSFGEFSLRLELLLCSELFVDELFFVSGFILLHFISVGIFLIEAAPFTFTFLLNPILLRTPELLLFNFCTFKLVFSKLVPFNIIFLSLLFVEENRLPIIVVRTGFIGFSSNLFVDGDFIIADDICFLNVGDNFDCCSLLKS